MKKLLSLFAAVILVFSQVICFADEPVDLFNKKSDVELNHIWTVTFNREINRNEKDEIKLSLYNNTLKKNEDVNSYINDLNKKEIKISPKENYKPDSEYTLTVKSNKMKKVFKKNFRTTSKKDSFYLKRMILIPGVDYMDVTVNVIGSNIAENITLYETDKDGKIINNVGTMIDNGVAPDKISGDGIYSIRHKISTSDVVHKYYMIKAGENIISANERTAARIGNSQVNNANTILKKMNDKFESDLRTNDKKTALNKVKSAVSKEKGVKNIHIANDSLFFEKDNVGCVILANEENSKLSRKSETTYTNDSTNNSKSNDTLNNETYLYNAGENNLSVETKDSIANSIEKAKKSGRKMNVLILEPVDDFGEAFSETINELKKNSNLFNIVQKTYNNVTVRSFTEFKNYDIILISTHGCDDGENTFLMCNYENSNLVRENIGRRYIRLLPHGDLLLSNEFIDYYNDELNGSFVYTSACQTAKSPFMANALLNSGASCFVGYTESVLVPYAEKMDNSVLSGMISGQNFQNSVNDSENKYGKSDAEFYRRIGLSKDEPPASLKCFGQNGYRFIKKEKDPIENDPYFIKDLYTLTEREDYLQGNWIGKDVYTDPYNETHDSKNYYFIRKNPNGTYNAIERMISTDVDTKGKSVVFKYSNLIYNPNKDAIFFDRSKSSVIQSDFGKKWYAKNVDFYLSGGVMSCDYDDGYTAYYEKYIE